MFYDFQNNWDVSQKFLEGDYYDICRICKMSFIQSVKE